MSKLAQSKKFAEIKAAITAEPERFLDDPDILRAVSEHLKPAHPKGDNILDIRDFTIERMHKSFVQLQKQHDDTISMVHDNFKTLLQIHSAVLHLLNCRSLGDFLSALDDGFFDVPRVDAALFILSEALAKRVEIGAYKRVLILGEHDMLVFQKGRTQKTPIPIALRPAYQTDMVCYETNDAPPESEALLSFFEEEDGFSAIFAMASLSAEQFKFEQNTEFLEFFRASMGCMLKLWLTKS